MSEDKRPAIDDIIEKLPTYLRALIGSAPTQEFGPLDLHTHSGTPGVIARYSIVGRFDPLDAQMTLEFSKMGKPSFAIVLGVQEGQMSSAEVQDHPTSGYYALKSRVQTNLANFLAEEFKHRDPGYARALAKFTRVYLDAPVGERVLIPV